MSSTSRRSPTAEYDQLLRELTDLETAHPELVTADSPTQRVGASPQSDFKPHTHRQPMLSLANAFNDDELRAFDEKVKRHLGLAEDAAVEYVTELKIDGLAISLTYENGIFSERRDTRRRLCRRRHHREPQDCFQSPSAAAPAVPGALSRHAAKSIWTMPSLPGSTPGGRRRESRYSPIRAMPPQAVSGSLTRQ